MSVNNGDVIIKAFTISRGCYHVMHIIQWTDKHT